jgi:hypothetical protein
MTDAPKVVPTESKRPDAFQETNPEPAVVRTQPAVAQPAVVKK